MKIKTTIINIFYLDTFLIFKYKFSIFIDLKLIKKMMLKICLKIA